MCVCVFGLGFRLRPATPGWGVGLCVCSCARSACTQQLLARVRDVGVCVWAQVLAAPRHSWRGCWGVGVPVCALCLHPATPGWHARCGCVCLGSGFGCAPPLLARVLGCVCAGVGALLAPRHSWLGCAPWVCVFGLGFVLHPATHVWGVGVCVCWFWRSACTPPLLARVRTAGVCLWARVSAAPRRSWLGCWGVCVLVWALRLHPTNPGLGGRCGCVCLGSGFCCPPPVLARVLGCVCAGVGALLAPRHSWLGCAPWVCVFGLESRPRSATPGWGVGVCVCRCACPPRTPPLLAGVCGVGVCVWARVWAAPATPGWGVGVCVCWCACSSCTPPLLAAVCGLSVLLGLWLWLCPADPGWGVGLCVCSCARSACTMPLLAGVRGVSVCVWARVSAAPRNSWLGCWAVCVLVCALCLHPATPGSDARCGCVCLGWGFGCDPPLLAGVLGCVCARVRAPLTPSHSWHGCAVCVCVFGLGFRLRPATPGWGVRRGCVCWGSGFGCTLPLPAGVCGVLVGCCLAPVRVPWFVACCARSPGSWHPAAVAAWHLSFCLGCGRRRASLACLVALRGASRLVRSGRSRCPGRLSRGPGAFPHPGGLRPRYYWAAAQGTRRPAENRALCACRWPPPRRGRLARSALYPFGALRWGCPWRVPPALVLGCVRCGGWRVSTRSLTRRISRNVRRSTGDWAGAPGLFPVDADTAPCWSEDATPGSRACVRVLALLGRVGLAGLPGAFWCASPFLLAALAF